MQELTFICTDHPSSYLSFMLLKEGKYEKRLLCSECLYSAQPKYDYDDTIPIATVILKLKKALKSPHKILLHKKPELSCIFYEFCDLDLIQMFKEQIMKFELFINIWKQIKEEFINQYKYYWKLQKQLRKEKYNFVENNQCNQLRQLILQLKEHQNEKSDQYISHLTKISSLIEEIKRIDISEIQVQIKKAIQKVQIEIKYPQILNSHPTSTQQCKDNVNSLFNQFDQFMLQMNETRTQLCGEIGFKILSIKYFSELKQKIERDSQKQLKQKNLIYLGSRDGLNNDAFWGKVNGKKNLLMIFQSKNHGNYVFGGYSPCQWSSNQRNWVQDDTLTSFLFSQTNNQIYPLKQDKKQYAIYCVQGYGPMFGGGYDLCINSDFNQGYSKLGNSYQLDQDQIHNSILFGGPQPNIEESEIYELIFQ